MTAQNNDKEFSVKIAVLETKQNSFMEQNAKDHLEIKDTMEQGFKLLGEKIDEISKNKANIWVEKFLIWAGMIIGAGLITFLGSLIYKATIQLN